MLFGPSHAEKVKADKQKRPLSKEEIMHFNSGSGLQIPKSSIRPKQRKPETVRVVTKDLIRDIVVPSDEPIGNTITMSGTAFGNLMRTALDKDNSDQMIAAQKRAERERIQAEMKERKDRMKELDSQRKENKPLNDLEIESRTIQQELLKRSQAKRLEENDEIKHLNELILEAKCHAIRDEQIKEKADIHRNMEVENARLDSMMELDRVSALQQRERVEEARKEQRQRGALQILDQIELNRMEKLLKTERKDQEARLLVENQRQLQMQDLEEIENRRNEQRQLQAEIDLINQEHKRQKAIRQEQEQLADMRVVKYQKEKAEREAAAEAAQEELRRQKELEIAKLRAAQERASDLQAERDALRAKRHEETTEREYRRKIREEQAKKSAMEAEMAEAREEQIQAKRHLMAVQAARERSEFDKSLLEQQKEVAAIYEQDKVRQNGQLKYAGDLRQQILGREQERIQQRKDFFEETSTMDKDIDNKNKKLDEVKRGKLKELTDSGVPAKYVQEVARRIGLDPSSI